MCADRAQCHSSSTCLLITCQQRHPLHSLRLLCRNPEAVLWHSPSRCAACRQAQLTVLVFWGTSLCPPPGPATPPSRHLLPDLARLRTDLALLWTLRVIVTHVWVYSLWGPWGWRWGFLVCLAHASSLSGPAPKCGRCSLDLSAFPGRVNWLNCLFPEPGWLTLFWWIWWLD